MTSLKICRKRNLQKSIQLNVLHAYSFLWLYCFFNLSEIHILLSNIWRIQRFFTMISHHYHLSSLSEHFFWRPNLWNAYHGIMYFIVCKCIAYVNAISFSWSLYLITQIVFIIQIHFLCIQNFYTYPSIKFVNSFDHGILMIFVMRSTHIRPFTEALIIIWWFYFLLSKNSFSLPVFAHINHS